MMSAVPPGWVNAPLPVVIYFQEGPGLRKHQFSTQGVPFLNIRTLLNGRIDLAKCQFVDASEVQDKYRHFLLDAGDIVVSSSGTLGKTAVVHSSDLPVMLNTSIVRMRPQPGAAITPEFILQFLRSEVFLAQARAASTGSAQVNYGPSHLREMEVPLPPLNEQRRIVAKLESLQSRSRRAREALDAVPPLLEKLRQSILAAAFRGDLTKDWRAQNPNPEPASALLARIRTERRQKWEAAELAKLKAKGKAPTNDSWKAKYKEPEPIDTTGLPDLPAGWCWASLDELLDSIQSGRSPRAEGRAAGPGEFGVLKVSAVTWGKFDATENKALLPGEIVGDTPTVGAGDLFISRANTVQLVGAVAIAERAYPNLMLSDKTLRLVRVNEEVSAHLLLYALRTRIVRRLFEGDATGTSDSMRNLSQEKILSAPIALPPAQEARKLVGVLQGALEQANATLGVAHALETQFESLNAALLTKAFRGELVRQDPNDQPADTMLARVRIDAPADSARQRSRRAKAAE